MSFAGGKHGGPDTTRHRGSGGQGRKVVGRRQARDVHLRHGAASAADQERRGIVRSLKPSLIVMVLTDYPLLTLLAAVAFGVLVFGRILP